MHPVKFLKIFFLVALASCSNEAARPDGLLSEKQMVQIMVDAHIFEAVIEERKIPEDSLAVYVETNYQEIFKKHRVSEQQYKRTFEYYESNPAKMDAMMDQVIDELSKVEARVKAQEKSDTVKQE